MLHVAEGPPAEIGQMRGKFCQPGELLFIPPGTILRVISILLSALRIAAGGLNVSVLISGDPDVLPGGRDGKRTDAGEGLRISDFLAARSDVGERSARSTTVNSAGRQART